MFPQSVIDRFLPAELRGVYREYADYLDERLYFTRPQSPIHAKPHELRVLIFTLLLGEGENRAPEWQDMLAQAAIFHDTRRINDGIDKGHGARAAEYYREYCAGSDLPFYPQTEFMITYHVPSDAVGERALRELDLSDRERSDYWKLYRIFKDADALDRFRLGRYGLNPAYLRTPTAHRLVDTAAALYRATRDF